MYNVKGRNSPLSTQSQKRNKHPVTLTVNLFKMKVAIVTIYSYYSNHQKALKETEYAFISLNSYSGYIL